MINIEQKARDMVLEVLRESELPREPTPIAREYWKALCRAIEQHEAFKQEVSRVMTYFKALYPTLPTDYDRFIIPAPKPDPLVEAWIEATGNTVGMEPLNAALEARGLEIRSKNDD